MMHQGTVLIETERLILRRFVPEDLKPMFQNCWSNNDVWKWSSYDPMNSLDDIRNFNNIFTDFWFAKYDRSDYYDWAIQLKATNEAIGRIRGIHIDERTNQAELVYELGTHWWNRGMMTEAARSVMAFFFKEVGMNRISANHADANPASGEVMKKCGMRYEGTMRQVLRCNNGLFNQVHYAILAKDYFKTI